MQINTSDLFKSVFINRNYFADIPATPQLPVNHLAINIRHIMSNKMLP